MNDNNKLKTLSLDGVGSLTEQIIRTISESIVAGVYLTGEQIPSEVALAEQFDISRQTVHKAMSALAKSGLVFRRKKAGTIVAEQKAFMLPMQDISDDVLKKGQTYHYEIGTRETFENGQDGFNWPQVANDIAVECVTCIHYADDAPVQLEIRMVNLGMALEFEEEDFSDISPTKWLFHHVPWSQVEHEISAIAANEDIAEKLNCSIGDACLLVQRTTHHKEQVITFASLISVGGRSNLNGQHSPIS